MTGIGVVASILVGVAAPAAAAGETGLELAPGAVSTDDGLRLGFTLTNTSGQACGLSTVADGSLQVLSVRRDGVELTPTVAEVAYEDGLPSAVLAHTAPVEPGASVTVELVSVPAASAAATEATSGAVLVSVTALPSGTGLAELWPVAEPGAYEVTAAYGMAAVEGAVCDAVTGPATISFQVGGDDAGSPLGGDRRWLLVGGAVLVLMLAGLTIVLVRRSRGGAAAVILLAIPALVVGGTARPAEASYMVAGADPGSAGYAAVTGCLDSIAAGDPLGLGAWLTSPDSPLVTIRPYPSTVTKTFDTNGYLPGSSSIVWDYGDNTSGYENDPGVVRDPCAAFYHEVQHAKDIADTNRPRGAGGLPGNPGRGGQEMCGNTGISKREVRATMAENAYRRAHGLPERTTYDGKKLPDNLSDCDKPPTSPTRPPRGPQRTYCEGVSGDGCGSTNGDPHLATFDGLFYDMQAVGEFVVVRSTAGDPLEVQARQTALPLSDVASVNSAVALAAGGHVVTIALVEGVTEVRVDGEVTTPAEGETPLPGGATLIRRASDTSRASGYELVWPDGSAAAVDQIGRYGYRLLVKLDESRAGTVQGLLGDFDGDPNNDAATPDGQALPQPLAFDDLYPAYADAWRVTDATSLLPYGPGQNTATFTDRAFPRRPFSLDDLDAAARDRVEATCRAAGVTAGWQLDQCRYDVAVTGRVEFATASASTQLVAPVAVSLPPAQPIASGTLRAGGDRLTFSAHAGDAVYVRVSAPARPAQCFPLRLLDPTGAEVDRGCLLGNDGGIDRVELTQDGDHAVLLDPSVTGTGPVLVRVYQAHTTTATIIPDGPTVSGEIREPGSILRYTFTGRSGQRVFVDEVGSTLPATCFPLRLFDPTGAQVDTGCVLSGYGYLESRPLPLDGSYTLVVDPVAAGFGTIDLRLVTVIDVVGTITVNGPPVVATIATPGATARYTFTAPAGTTVTVRPTDPTLPPSCFPVRLLGPDGGLLDQGCVLNETSPDNGIPAATLPVTGTYTVLIDPSDKITGAVTITLSA